MWNYFASVWLRRGWCAFRRLLCNEAFWYFVIPEDLFQLSGGPLDPTPPTPFAPAAAAAATSLQLCPTLCDPIDGSPPDSPVLGILQARTLDWVAVSFSSSWKWKVKSESEVAQSCPTLSDPMDCSLPGPSVRGIFQARGLGWGASASSAFAPRIWLISRRSPRQFGVVSVAPGSIICGPGIWPGTSIMCLGQIPHLY